MNHAGDAAEQIVRMSLEGVEFAVRITGGAAKEIAAFIMGKLVQAYQAKFLTVSWYFRQNNSYLAESEDQRRSGQPVGV